MNLIEVINRVRQIRDKANLSARELCLMLGKNSTYITKLESGEFKPSMEIILEIISCCNSTPQEFFYYKINEYNKDKTIIDLLKNVDEEKKKAIISLLSK